MFISYIMIANDLFEVNQDYALKYFEGKFNQLDEPYRRVFIDSISKNLKDLTTHKSYERYFGQLAFARLIDNFIAYLKDLLGEIINSKPQVLRSSESEKLDFILSFDTIEEMRNAIAEKKIEKLFYGSFNDINKFFLHNLGIEIFSSQDELEIMESLCRKRNLIVHNRGIINNEFLKKYSDLPFKVGDVLLFTFDSILEGNTVLFQLAHSIDEQVALKFELNRQPFFRVL